MALEVLTVISRVCAKADFLLLLYFSFSLLSAFYSFFLVFQRALDSATQSTNSPFLSDSLSSIYLDFVSRISQ